MTTWMLGETLALEWLYQILLVNGRILLLFTSGFVLLRYSNNSAARRHLFITAIFVAALLLPFVSQWLPAIVFEIEVERTLSNISQEGMSATVTDDSQLNGTAAYSSNIFLAAYCSIALLLICRIIVGNIKVVRLIASAHHDNLRDWQMTLSDCAKTIKLNRSIIICHTDKIKSPMTWGFFRAAILIPSDALHWPETLRRSALLHELAHIRRRDCITKQLAHLVCALYWLNPLCWVALKRFNHPD